MSGQRDTDDLIAELSKLMAAENGGDSGPVPRAVTPPPVSAAPHAAVPQTIRIPGQSQPAAASGLQQAAPEPRANWQDRLGGRAAGNGDPQSVPPVRREPSLGTGNVRPAAAPGEAAHAPPAPPAFDFDFGFNRERPELGAKPAAAPVPPPRAEQAPQRQAPAAAAPVARPMPPQPLAAPPVAYAAPHAASPARDPIADLIAADLDEHTEPVRDEPPAPPGLPQPIPAPASARLPQESDRFATAPVFGLGNRPAGVPVTPKVQLDPMDEIESLIGEAVRVELNMPPPQHPVRAIEPMVARAVPVPAPPQPQQQAPVVPPLVGQFPPRRTTSLRDAESTSGGPDEAILAAVAAGGTTVGRVDGAFADERRGRTEKPSRRTRQADRRQAVQSRRDYEDDEPASGGPFKQLVVPAVAALVLVAGGFGAYWALGMNHNSGRPPVLTVDATPAKTIPPKTAADDSAPHSVVMDELSGNAPQAASQETLVSRDQTAGDNAAQVANQSANASTDDGGLANRKVRTVTVRPDGTIVSGDDSVAGAAQLPVDRPNVPDVPGSVSVASADSAPVAAPMALPDAPAAADSPAAADLSAAPAADSVATPSNAPIPLPRPPRRLFAAGDASNTDTPPTASVRPRSAVNAVRGNGDGQPVDLIGSLVTQSDSGASQQSAQVADPTDAASAPRSVAHVQLSSQPSAAAAQSSASAVQRRFGSLFGGVKLQIVKVDLPKGTYYRVMLPASSLQNAQQMCSSIKASGGDCVAGNG